MATEMLLRKHGVGTQAKRGVRIGLDWAIQLHVYFMRWIFGAGSKQDVEEPVPMANEAVPGRCMGSALNWVLGDFPSSPNR